MGGSITKEQAISSTQYLDLVYSQSGTLYDLIPHAPRPTTDPSRPTTELPVDGILGSVQTQTMTKSSKKQAATPSNQQAPPAKTTFSHVASIGENMIQSTESSGENKKGKNKSKKLDNQQEGNKTQNTDNDSKGKRKVKYPCLIYGGDHFTKECPRREEVGKILKSSPTPTVLKYPFSSQQQLIDHKSLNEASSSIDEVCMMSSEMVNLNTRAHSYDPPPENKPDDIPSEKTSTSTPPTNNGLHIEKPIPEVIFHAPKGTLHKSIINPNARVTQYYNIVEYLA